MDMLWPGFLALLGLIPLMIIAYVVMLRRRRRYAVRYSSLSLVREAAKGQSKWRRHVPFALFLLALSSLTAAMTRPVSIVAVPTTQTTVVLSIDVSRSMCSTDIAPNRLLAAEAAALQFVERQSAGTHIGVVAFAGFAEVVQMPTEDQELLREAIEGLAVGRRTAIGSGLLKALDVIAEVDPSVAPTDGDSPGSVQATPVPDGAYAPAIVVLLTDGVSNAGPPPLEVAQQAVDRGIRVYTIGFGTASGQFSPTCGPQFAGREPVGSGGGFGGFGGGGGFRRGIDEETLRQVAQLTDGAYYSAESATELASVFQNLPTHLITRYETTEISAFFAAGGALLAALAMLLSMRWSPQV